VALVDGAFDVLHSGHVRFLEEAREAGGALVVALHSDAVVRSNKGAGRPLNTWQDRAAVLSALRSVDLVTELQDRFPDKLIRSLRPGVYAKGTDFVEANVRERALVESLGGRVLICGGPQRRPAAGDRSFAKGSGFAPAWQGARRVPAQRGKLTIVVPTKNEEANIGACLASASWADEVIVCDSYSADRTCEIAAEHTPNVVQHEYVNSATQKNWIIPQAAGEWVFILDADERITSELREAIQEAVRAGQLDGYRVERRSYFLGKRIRRGGWGLDHPLRLFRREKGRYQDREVHAAVMVAGEAGNLRGSLEHHSIPDLRVYFEKSERYSWLAAADLFRSGSEARWWHLLLRPMSRFVGMYFLKLGMLDGFHGLLLAGLSAMTVAARYAKLWEMNRRGEVGELPSGRA